jgi:hypothetical protein
VKNLFIKIKQFFQNNFFNCKSINYFVIYITVTEIIKFFIYPIIIEGEYSPYQSILSLVLISLVVRSITLDIYDLKEGDWFKIEIFKLNHNAIIENSNKFIKMIKKISKFGGNLLLFIAFIVIEPLIFILLFRKGDHQWNGLTWQFKILFVISNIIAIIPLYLGIKIVIKFIGKIIMLIF